MTYGGLRVLGAGVLAMLCAWAGARLYVNWRAHSAAEIRVPAGFANAASDASDDAAVAGFAAQLKPITDTLPEF